MLHSESLPSIMINNHQNLASSLYTCIEEKTNGIKKHQALAPTCHRPLATRSRVVDLEISLARRGAVGGRQRLGETVEDQVQQQLDRRDEEVKTMREASWTPKIPGFLGSKSLKTGLKKRLDPDFHKNLCWVRHIVGLWMSLAKSCEIRCLMIPYPKFK